MLNKRCYLAYDELYMSAKQLQYRMRASKDT